MARPSFLPSPGDISVIVRIRALGGGWKPILVAFQESFYLAFCLQGSVRNQGDRLSSLHKIKGFPVDVGLPMLKLGQSWAT